MKNAQKIAVSLVEAGKTSKAVLRKTALAVNGLSRAKTKAERAQVDKDLRQLERQVKEVKDYTTINPNFFRDLEAERKARQKEVAKERRARQPKKEKNKKEKKKKEPFLGTEKQVREMSQREEIIKYNKELRDYTPNGEKSLDIIPYYDYNKIYNSLYEKSENIEEIVIEYKGNNYYYGRDLNAAFNFLRKVSKDIAAQAKKRKSKNGSGSSGSDVGESDTIYIISLDEGNLIIVVQ